MIGWIVAATGSAAPTPGSARDPFVPLDTADAHRTDTRAFSYFDVRAAGPRSALPLVMLLAPLLWRRRS